MPIHPRARATALDLARAAATANRDQLLRALAHYPAPTPKADRILNLVASGFGVSDHAPLSNFGVRMRSVETLVDLFLQLHDAHRADRDMRHFLFTGTWDHGITGLAAPVLNLARLELKVRRLLKRERLDGVCIFEIAVLAKPLTGEADRLLLLHVHALCWTRDQYRQPVTRGRELSALAQYKNRLGLPGVTFVSRAMSAARHRLPQMPGHPALEIPRRFRNLQSRDQNAHSMAYLAHYMLEAPTAAKGRYQDRDGRWHTCHDRDAFGLNTALRFAEIWSQLTPADAVFGVGPEGGRLSREFSQRMRPGASPLPQHRQQSLRRVEVEHAWQRLFDAHPRLGLEPSEITRRAD